MEEISPNSEVLRANTENVLSTWKNSKDQELLRLNAVIQLFVGVLKK